MSFLETYGKEIVAIIVPLLTWVLNTLFRAKARLQVASPHRFTFLVPEPLLDQQGNQVASKQTVHTSSFLVRNAGRESATKVELVFNYKPMCLNVWPPRHFEEHIEPDDRYVLLFESLSPSEVVGCELLSVNANLPDLTTVRCDESVAQHIEMYPQPILSNARRRVLLALSALGLATVVYIAIVLVQFLVLRTPLGH